MLLLTQLADFVPLQDLEVADHRRQRCAELVGHTCHELRLVAVGTLETSVRTPKLLAHPVQVGGQSPQLVAVRYLHLTREIAGGELVEAAPERFYVPPYVGPKGWIGIYLGDETDWDELADLVEESYRMTAPKRLAALLDQPGR